MISRWKLFRRTRFLDKNADFRKSHGIEFQNQFQRLSMSVRNIHQSHYVASDHQEKRPDFVTVESSSRLHRSTLTPFEQFMEWIQLMRYRAGLIVYDKYVQKVVVLLILLNAIVMGIDTFHFVRQNPDVANSFDKIDLFFLIVFTIELGMQFIFHGVHLLRDGWLVFDLVVITTSWAVAELRIVRAFRIFRAFRLITRIKVMKNLVLAIFSVVPRMFAIGLLLLLVSYIYAVMCTQLFKDLYDRQLTDEDYFGRLDRTAFTLFQLMTLDAWPDVARQVMAVYSWAWFPIGSYVIITAFVVVNLIVAVICDAISALHADEKAKLHGKYEEGESSVENNERNAVGEGINDEDGESSLFKQQSQSFDIHTKVEAMEEHVMELMRMQEESIQILANLTQHLQTQRQLVVRNPTLSPGSDNSMASVTRGFPDMQGEMSEFSSDKDSADFENVR